MEINKPSRRRRYHEESFKQAVIEACREPGTSVAGIALANGVNANQVRRWMRERGIAPPNRRTALVASAPPAFIPVTLAQTGGSLPDIRLELRRGDVTVAIQWPVGAAIECGAWLREWLR
ncbi:MAG: transposase [Azonexus sp.]|nr:transposase [Azonexus sp.]